MALSANAEVDRQSGEILDVDVAASTTIYKGAIVGDNASGYARGLVAGDPFKGVAYEKMDNSSGAAGDLSGKVWRTGRFLFSGSGFTKANEDDKVYASADNTVTTTSGSNTLIGRIAKYVSATQVWVDIDTVQCNV